MEPPAFYNDLTLTEAEAWRLIARGAADRHSPYHLMQLASLGMDADGLPSPRLRTVVLRAVVAKARVLRFHTDARSPKGAELAACPRVQVLFYDPGHKIQLRLDATAAPAPDELRRAAWAATNRHGRLCYAVTRAPSSPQAVPAADFAAEAEETVFQPYLLTVSALDWLYLAAQGHRRARFAYGADGSVTHMGWLTP